MIAAGWGKTKDSSSISQFLKKLNVEIITNEKCAETFGEIVQKTTICSIGIEGNSGTCQVRALSKIWEHSWTRHGPLALDGRVVQKISKRHFFQGIKNSLHRITQICLKPHQNFFQIFFQQIWLLDEFNVFSY